MKTTKVWNVLVVSGHERQEKKFSNSFSETFVASSGARYRITSIAPGFKASKANRRALERAVREADCVLWGVRQSHFSSDAVRSIAKELSKPIEALHGSGTGVTGVINHAGLMVDRMVSVQHSFK